MQIQLKKFGTTLISRQAGKEAFAALQPLLADFSNNDCLEIHFDEVITFSPSWGDEFITKLVQKYGDRVELYNTSNPSVRETLKLLQEISNMQFNIKN